MPYTLWFDKAGKEAIGLVGGKNASLGELINTYDNGCDNKSNSDRCPSRRRTNMAH